MSFRVKWNILWCPRLNLPLPNWKPWFNPNQCACFPTVLAHPLNQGIHYMYCSYYAMVSFNKQMWNSTIVAPGYWNGGLQSGSGHHINLPCALPRSQTLDISHIPEGDPMLFTTCVGSQQAAAGPCHRGGAHPLCPVWKTGPAQVKPVYSSLLSTLCQELANSSTITFTRIWGLYPSDCKEFTSTVIKAL